MRGIAERPPIFGDNPNVKDAPVRFTAEASGDSFEVRDFDGRPVVMEASNQEAGMIASDLQPLSTQPAP
jgi:hypothetical protein